MEPEPDHKSCCDHGAEMPPPQDPKAAQAIGCPPEIAASLNKPTGKGKVKVHIPRGSVLQMLGTQFTVIRGAPTWFTMALGTKSPRPNAPLEAGQKVQIFAAEAKLSTVRKADSGIVFYRFEAPPGVKFDLNPLHRRP